MTIHPHAEMTALVVPHDAHWAIEETAARAYLSMMRGVSVSAHMAEVEARGKSDDSREYPIQEGIAYLSLTGPMTKSPTSFGTGTSTSYLRRQIRSAGADKDVKAIVLRIDSPGGSVGGTDDLAADVKRVSASKPVYAYVEDQCCSAALWVASQATRVYANKTALVGSIGTYMVLYDSSKAAEKEGIEVLVFSTGDHKGAGVPGAKITDEQKADFQRVVDDLNAHFLAAVASGRNLSMQAIKQIATGQVWIASQALERNLVDRVCSMDEAVREILGQSPMTGSARADEAISVEAELPAGSTFAEDSDRALAAVRVVTNRAEAIKAMRERDGRTLSRESLGQIRTLAEETKSLSDALFNVASADPRDALARAVLAASISSATQGKTNEPT